MAIEIATNVVREYSDIDLNFIVHPVRKDLNRLTNEIAIINSVKNLILTNFYEKPFRPNIGSNVRKLLFENMDVVTATAVERAITETINNYEPRVKMKNLIVSPNYDQNAFSVTMEFYVSNRVEPIKIKFLLERTR